MGKFILLAALALCGLSGAAQAQNWSHAGPYINTEASGPAVEPSTRLDGRQWLAFESKFFHLDALRGKPMVLVFNATPDEITVSCDGKWDLVGAKPYKSVSENPRSLAPWSFTIISTEGFDGYCKSSLTANASGGFSQYKGVTEIPGDFSGSRYIAFYAQ